MNFKENQMKNAVDLDDYQTFQEAGFVELTKKVEKNYTAQELEEIDKEITKDMERDYEDEF